MEARRRQRQGGDADELRSGSQSLKLVVPTPPPPNVFAPECRLTGRFGTPRIQAARLGHGETDWSHGAGNFEALSPRSAWFAVGLL